MIIDVFVAVKFALVSLHYSLRFLIFFVAVKFAQVSTLPFRINVYTRLFIQRLFSNIHFLIRAYTFINSRVSNVRFPRSSEFPKVRLQFYFLKIYFVIPFIYMLLVS